MRTTTPDKNNLEASEQTDVEVRYTIVIFNQFFGPDSDPPTWSMSWRPEPLAEYYFACEEAKRKAFEVLVPSHTLVAYREGEKRTGYNGEYEVLYKISDEEHCIRVCLIEKHGDADFKEWEV